MLNVCVYIYMYVCVYMYIYMYIYIERERVIQLSSYICLFPDSNVLGNFSDIWKSEYKSCLEM